MLAVSEFSEAAMGKKPGSDVRLQRCPIFFPKLIGLSASGSYPGAWPNSRTFSTSRWKPNLARSCSPLAILGPLRIASGRLAPCSFAKFKAKTWRAKLLRPGLVLVAQGTEAGGHGASRTTFDIVPAIVDLVRGQVPVVAAGGIADGRGLAASLMLGAAGVLLGTRFYASVEANGHEEAKKRICLASSGDTVRGIIFDISRNNVWPAPFTGRCLVNDHARRWAGRELELLQRVEAVAAEYAF